METATGSEQELGAQGLPQMAGCGAQYTQPGRLELLCLQSGAQGLACLLLQVMCEGTT